ncbi:MAG: 16S rRNA (guanine(966)-N(2))-methyltransferase RsmD [Firmicutes bacterium]|nr:16S rRNA (guanine(966)-N(2))-methyltransferase RsmD [Bacillota bacterium]
MRIITGLAKGHRIKAPKGLKTRPTTDRIKESLFNIIPDVSNQRVLDLFSGSGNIGIEFLSRGAEQCYFIDNNASSVKIIKENLKKTDLIKKANVYKNSVDRAIKILSKKRVVFDIIFLDPPYNKNLVKPTIEEISENNILSKEGYIIIEHESSLNLPEKISDLVNFDTRKYKDTSISFYRREEG